MSKKQTKPTTEMKITIVKKGEIYETKQQELLEVVNGRLKDEGDLGTSFEGRSITFDSETAFAFERLLVDQRPSTSQILSVIT